MSIDKIKPEDYWKDEPCDFGKNLADETELATERQVGGSHYKGRAQPIEYIIKNNISWCLGNSIKYITRSGKKGKRKDHIKDLQKAIHYIELELQHTYNVDPNGKPLTSKNIDCEKIDWEIFLDKQYLFYYQQNVVEIILDYDEWLQENEGDLRERYKDEGIV